MLSTALVGCSGGSLFEGNAGAGDGWFSKPVNLLQTPDWATKSVDNKSADLSPRGPVGPEDLVGPEGSCAASAEGVAPAGAQASAGDPVGAPEPVLGGIALGMTECQVVRRAGAPNNVALGADDRGERKVTLTYGGGTWPGIYTFSSGRLKVVDRVAEPAKPARPAAKKPRAKRTTS